MSNWVAEKKAVLELRKRRDLRRCDILKTLREAFATGASFTRTVGGARQVDIDGFTWTEAPLLPANSEQPFNLVAWKVKSERAQLQSAIAKVDEQLLLSDIQLAAQFIDPKIWIYDSVGETVYMPENVSVRESLEAHRAGLLRQLESLYPADIAAGI